MESRVLALHSVQSSWVDMLTFELERFDDICHVERLESHDRIIRKCGNTKIERHQMRVNFISPSKDLVAFSKSHFPFDFCATEAIFRGTDGTLCSIDHWAGQKLVARMCMVPRIRGELSKNITCV
jgi:hypothetical protein